MCPKVLRDLSVSLSLLQIRVRPAVCAATALARPAGRELIDFCFESHNLIVFRLEAVLQRLDLAGVRLLQRHNYTS